MTSDSKAVCGGNWAGFSADEIVRRTRCEADDRSAPYTSNTWRACCDLILARLKAAESAALASTAGAGAGDWVTVPRVLTPEMIQAAEHAKIGGTPCTMVDWVEGYSRQDVEDIGVIWPESPWDRGSIVTEDVHAILLKTWWAAMLSAVPASPRSVAGEGEAPGAAACRSAREKAVGQLQTLHRLADEASPPAPAEHGVEIRERIAAAIRKALVENWSDAVDARDWDEDVLLTGCRKVGGGKGYEKPEEAAQNLALEAADAALSALSQGGGAGRSEKGEGEGLERVHDAVAASARTAAEQMEWMRPRPPAPAQSPSTSDREG